MLEKRIKGGSIMSFKINGVTKYSVKDLSKKLPLSQLTIRKYIREGIIPGGQKIGQGWYVSKEDLKAYLQGNDKEVTDSKEMPPEPKF